MLIAHIYLAISEIMARYISFARGAYMTNNNTAKLSAYVARQKSEIEGWFGRIDAEIFRVLLTYQRQCGLGGGVAEIGVHHGKSFIALCLGLAEQERAYCVDLFGDQQHNQDNSGKGDRDIFISNLDKFGIERHRVTIRQSSSFDISGIEITDDIGEVRFFSVDGGHWLDVVENDLAVAESCLANHGIIALDDFHRAEWPDVSAGYFSWYGKQKNALVPFAIGFNKLYLCSEQWQGRYQRAITDDAFLKHFFVKTATFQGHNVPVFGEYILPENTFFARWVGYVKIFHPDFYPPAKRVHIFLSQFKFLRKIRYHLARILNLDFSKAR